ncbi:MAG TPA: EAL domain-containing protein [Acidimicrobiia bacterium]|nr:EAL domain-containing protein [Acidimicrobiia bacterium]
MRQLRALVVGLWLLAFMLWGLTARLPSANGPDPALYRALIVAALFGGAEVFVVHVKMRKDAHTFSFGEIALVVALFACDPRIAVIAAAVGAAVALAAYRGQRRIKLSFNIGKTIVETEVALLLFHAVVDPSTSRPAAFLAAGGAVVIASIVGCTLVTTAIALSEGGWARTAFRDVFGLGLVGTLVAVSAGLLSVLVAQESAWALGLLVAPVAGCFWFYSAFGHERHRTESLQFLYKSTRLLHESPALDDALVALLIETRTTLRARVAELVYNPPNGDTVLHIRIVDGEPPSVSTAEPAPATRELAEVALAFPRAQIVNADGPRCQPATAALANNDYRNALIARLDERGEAVGAIVIADHLVEVVQFGKHDADLVDALAGALSIALENGALERTLRHSRVLERKLQHLALHDSLTGLPNRVRFTERVAEFDQRRRATGENFSVLFVDLDDFKTINDSLGHHAGDELLAAVAYRLTSCISDDDMAARLGGDEFAIVCTDTDAATPTALAERIHGALTEPVAIVSGHAHVSASIGIAHSSDLVDGSELLRNADTAMYHAKASGKHRSVTFEPSMHQSMVERYELLNQLERAIDDHEITFLFQPVVALDGTLRGSEALARWKHPTRGIVPPEIFIPLAEETNLISRITHQALTEACRAISDGFVHRAGINISAQDLARPDFAESVRRVLDRWRIRPDDITLEITESQVMQDAEAMRAFSALRWIGVRLALDDFGTGYSSLAALRKFPINQLKIAKPFIDELETDPAALRFVELIVGLGKSLRMEVLAEGIERKSQVDLLNALGCHLGQGYYFDRPLSAERFRNAWKAAADLPDVTRRPALTLLDAG